MSRWVTNIRRVLGCTVTTSIIPWWLVFCVEKPKVPGEDHDHLHWPRIMFRLLTPLFTCWGISLNLGIPPNWHILDQHKVFISPSFKILFCTCGRGVGLCFHFIFACFIQKICFRSTHSDLSLLSLFASIYNHHRDEETRMIVIIATTCCR